MLFLKSLHDLTVKDVREFCRRFQEGLRVEYKETFDENVRRKIPVIVSSFANSYGGILIIGVRTNRGLVVEPIEGFETPKREELRLTVENICLQQLNPALIPRIQEIPSDVSGRSFLVVEVEESLEAPHAIENSRKVYIRTGDANNPYDLAEVGVIERLLERRRSVLAQWRNFERETNSLFQRLGRYPDWPQIRIVIGPRYPVAAICDREVLYRFLRDTHYGDTLFFPYQSLRRHPSGVCAFIDPGNYYVFGSLNTFGLVMYQAGFEAIPRTPPPSPTVRPGTPRFPFSRIVRHFHLSLTCAGKLYSQLRYRGVLRVEAKLFGVGGRSFFLPSGDFLEPLELSSVADVVPAESLCPAESLQEMIPNVTSELVHELIWPFGQNWDSISTERVRRFVARIVSGLSR